MITFQRSQQPKPFGVPDLFFQPLDNSNWTMLDLRWDSLMIQGYVVFSLIQELFAQKDRTLK